MEVFAESTVCLKLASMQQDCLFTVFDASRGFMEILNCTRFAEKF